MLVSLKKNLSLLSLLNLNPVYIALYMVYLDILSHDWHRKNLYNQYMKGGLQVFDTLVRIQENSKHKYYCLLWILQWIKL
jgi:hypothetical protein